MMKKFMVVFALIFSIILTFGFTVNAEETTTTSEVGDLPGGGVTPNSFFYRFDKFFENVSLKLTFSDEKRAEKLSRFAEERLAELNEIDANKAEKYADELFNEYGLNVEKANIYVQKLVAEGKLSDTKLAKLETHVQKAEMKQEKLKENRQEIISDEVKTQVQEAIQNAKMSIFNKFTNPDEMKTLHDEGYGYGELLKLQAISEISTKPISELLEIENAVVKDELNNKHINIEVILEATELTRDDLKTTLTEYRDNAKADMKNSMEEAKKNAEERIAEIKERAKSRAEEQKENKDN